MTGFPELFSRALAGEACLVSAPAGVQADLRLPVQRWTGRASAQDDRLLSLCQGSTIDLGCGPGRLTERLAELGHVTLGVDIVLDAVERTRARGVSAVHRDLFERLPGEGRWRSVLLADGNVGIGGDPVSLLSRAARIAGPEGRIVVEIHPPGTPMSRGSAFLELVAGPEPRRSHPFPWAVVGVDDVATVAAASGLLVASVTDLPALAPTDHPRWAAVLTAGPVVHS